MSIVYNKLVRDLIPDIISEEGRTPVTHIADDEEYGRLLSEKLAEEVAEFRDSGDAEELADVLEVVHALCQCHGHSIDDVEKLRLSKRRERGGFERRIILEKVESSKS